MKKNIILPGMIVLAIITCTIFISDGLTYSVTSLMAVAIMGTIHRKRSRGMKITRWAKANPKKAQVFITGLLIALMVTGIIAGFNFKELGHEFSNTTAYVFSTIIVIGFFMVPFLPERSTVVIPKVVNRHRLAYMGIALSSFVMMVVFGNRIGDHYPNSSITHVVRAIDQAIFSNDNIDADLYGSDPAVYSENYDQALTNESNMAVFASFTIYGKDIITSPTLSKKEAREKLKAEKKVKRFERKKARMMNLVFKKRIALAAVLGAGAIVLIVLLVLTTCAGVCLMVAGFAGGASGGVGYGILGLFIAVASIFGIVKISQGNKRKRKTEP